MLILTAIIFSTSCLCLWALNCFRCKDEICGTKNMEDIKCHVDDIGCYIMELENGSKARGCAPKDFSKSFCKNLNRRRDKGYTSYSFCTLCQGYHCNEKVNYLEYLPPKRKVMHCYNCEGKYCGYQAKSDIGELCDEQECYIMRRKKDIIEQGCRKDGLFNFSYCKSLNKSSSYESFCVTCKRNLCNKLRRNQTTSNETQSLTCYFCEGALCLRQPYKTIQCDDHDKGCFRLLKYGLVLGRGCGHVEELDELCDVTQRRTHCGICRTNLCNSTENNFSFFNLFLLSFIMCLFYSV